MQVVQQASVHMPVDERGLTGGWLTEAAAVVAVRGAQAIMRLLIITLPSSGVLCVNWMVCSVRLLPCEKREGVSAKCLKPSCGFR